MRGCLSACWSPWEMMIFLGKLGISLMYGRSLVSGLKSSAPMVVLYFSVVNKRIEGGLNPSRHYHYLDNPKGPWPCYHLTDVLSVVLEQQVFLLLFSMREGFWIWVWYLSSLVWPRFDIVSPQLVLQFLVTGWMFLSHQIRLIFFLGR